MENKMQLECMDIECRTVMFGHFLEGMRCVNCGGLTRERLYKPVIKQIDQNKNRELKIEVNADTTEALKGIKEVTKAANECVAALEKLDKIMEKFTNRNETVELYCNGEVIAQTIVQSND